MTLKYIVILGGLVMAMPALAQVSPPSSGAAVAPIVTPMTTQGTVGGASDAAKQVKPDKQTVQPPPAPSAPQSDKVMGAGSKEQEMKDHPKQ